MKAPLVAAVLVAGLLVSEQAHAADILVTVTEQRVKGGPGCSLQEAIFSANFDESKAISTYDALGDAVFTPTNCVPGSGPDRLILPFRATFKMANPILDPMNPFGPGATPMVTSTIVIEGNGSVVMSTTWYAGRAFAVESAGHLTISNLSVQQFSARGGSGASTAPGVPHDGGGGGGGGMGAGGAAFVRGGTLVIRNSSFVDNTALGGTGGTGHFGGGGGGLGGHGGWGGIEAGGGGGGARAGGNDGRSSIGGDGGGTVIGRLRCGGFGGGKYVNGPNGEFIDPPQSAECEGGGGGGGGAVLSLVEPGQAGHGAYGGGGGGGGVEGLGEGGAGGFGGGGGGSHGSVAIGAHGGDGGFGGGGGTGTNSNGRGGMFGGHASLYGGGGGGAGLGGGIFSDGGTIVLENSTFVGNEVRGGSGAVSPGGVGYSAESGEGHGGAVFSFGGRLILRNVTVARNRASTADSGIVMYKQVLVGGGQALTGVAELSINNSIIAENHFGGTGPDQPQCRGVDLIPTGVGNLIHNNGNCAGVVRTGDPFFGSFFISAPGNTPTLAIASNASEAFNTADPGTSLPLDQRGMPRPKQGGFDIGAYERCVARPETGISCTLPILEIPQTVLLTTLAAPLSGGSVSPVTGSVPENSVQQLVASPAAGWMFAGWTGDPVGNPASASTFIGMDTAHVVIANFVMWTARPAGRATPGSATAAPRVDLTWLGTGGADHYDVHRASVSGGPYALIGSSMTTAFSDRTAGLTNGGTYYYVIQAVAADATVFGKSSEAVVKIPLGR